MVRAEKRLAVRQAVLAAAVATVDARGMDALNIDDLAAAAGLSVGGLYRYFPGKGAILVELAKDALGRYDRLQKKLLADAAARLGRGATRALAAVLVGWAAYGEHARRAPQSHRVLDLFLSTQEKLLDRKQAPEVEAALAPILERSAGLFQRAAEVGALTPGDAALRTQVMWALVHGLDHLRKRDRLQPHGLHADDILVAGFDGLLLGWGASTRTLAAARRLAAR